MFVDHVDNARRRRHDERINLNNDGEGLAGPTDGLIHRSLLIQEAMNIGPHVRDDIVVCLFAGDSSFHEPVLVEETEVAAHVLLHW